MGNFISNQILRNQTKEGTSLFVPKFKYVKVIDVYDGDTITIIGRVDGSYYQFKCRLRGIDTPEIRTRDLKEKELGFAAKRELSDIILGKLVRLRNIGFEKYGRLLADVYLDGMHINQHMIDSKFAIPYPKA
jgi:micrococcal nuclease